MKNGERERIRKRKDEREEEGKDGLWHKMMQRDCAPHSHHVYSCEKERERERVSQVKKQEKEKLVKEENKITKRERKEESPRN